MKKTLVLFLAAISTLLASTDLYFMSDPSISADGKKIVFCYDGDIWLVPSSGGIALRLTAMNGNEMRPLFSPDGKWIAFSGGQEGNANVYIIPVEGGTIKQLSFHSANDLVESWSWDSKVIYFTSNRYNSITTYSVPVAGGTPKRLFEHYFNWPHNLVVHPKTGEYYFDDSWESSNQSQRKRYKGDFNPDIKSYNPTTGEFKVHTNYIGKDMWATIDEAGNVYFVSDEANGQYNLYKFVNGVKKQLTSFDTSIKRPRVSGNGEKVVFEKDYRIYLYDTRNGNSELVEIDLPDNYTLKLQQEFNVQGKITNFDISPDGKKIAFVSRGRLFVSDIDSKFVKELPTAKGERVVEVLWMKESQTLLYNRTVNGWLNLFTIKAAGNLEETQLTNERMNNDEINMNDDRTLATYFSGRDELKLLDLATLKSETIVEDEFWALYNAPARFSPDNKFIAYTAYRNFEQDIFIYDIQNKKSYNITNTGVTETNPFWSTDGKYIYFETDRLQPGYPRGTSNDDIYRIALRRLDAEYRSDRLEKLFAEEKKDTTKKVLNIQIDFEGIKDRWEAVETQNGSQNYPYVIQKEEQTTLLFVSDHNGENNVLWQSVSKPFEKTERKIIEGIKTGSLAISKSKENYYLLAEGKIFKLDLSASKGKAIDISFAFTKDLSSEFEQMFYETWANVDENFYDEKFHGVDWIKIREEYGRFIPHLRTRGNLRTLLNDMLGELNSSHLGFNSSGDEEKTFYKSTTMETGIMFRNDNPFVIDRIVKNSPVYKAAKEIQPGDRLVKVNEVRVDELLSREYYFTAPTAAEEISLTFERKGVEFTVKVKPITYQALSGLLYDEWVEWNQKFVDEKGKSRIAYVHMKNMGGEELKNFMIEITNELHYRDALIFDLRYNAGGNVHNDVLQFLSQRPYLQWKYRGGKLTQQPNFTPAAKPIVLLINEQTLSDAEMTAEGFKALKLGKVIGTETYRWIIFTSGKSLVDGSFYRLPSWGCYSLDGRDLEMTGVAPDIYIRNSFKDKLGNRDPQLEKAIDEILKELK